MPGIVYGRWNGKAFVPTYRPPRRETYAWALPRLQDMPTGFYRIGPGDAIERIE